MELGRPFATVTPTLDGDVLAILATSDATFTTGQIHRILNRFSEEGIRKVLSRLVLQGVVRAERVGNAFAYRFNSEHLAADAIMALARLPNTFLSRLEAPLAAWQEPPAYAAMFGSAATGAMTVASDIDLFLVRSEESSDDLWARQVGELATTVNNWTGNDLRSVEYTVAGLRAARDESVVRDVANDGLTVAGTRVWLLRQLGKSRKASSR